jgi:hypothetical protein
MSTQNIGTLAIGVVDQYHAAGKSLVQAYRAGTARALGAFTRRFAAALNARELPLVSAPVKASVIDAQQQVAQFVAYGFGLPAAGADITIDQLTRRVSSGIERATQAGAKVESLVGASTLDKVGVFALPVARLSLEVANAVAEGSKRLSQRLAAEPVVVETPAEKPARKTPRKPSARRARA